MGKCNVVILIRDEGIFIVRICGFLYCGVIVLKNFGEMNKVIFEDDLKCGKEYVRVGLLFLGW